MAARTGFLFTNARRSPLSIWRLFSERSNSFSTRSLTTSTTLMQQQEDIEENPFYSKYADKIKKAQLAKGGKSQQSSPEEKFQHDQATRDAAEQFKRKIKTNVGKDTLGINQRTQSGEKAVYGNKSLESIMHLDKLTDKNSEEIEQIWREYHRNKDCISATIPGKLYDRIEERAKQFPLFLYALPKEQGYEFVYSEFHENQCYFTSLINYQTLGENAPWSLVLTHFTELKESKGIVLMVGELDKQSMSILDAQFLAYQVQMFYSSDKKQRENLLYAFNREPNTFDHMDIIREISSEVSTGTPHPEK